MKIAITGHSSGIGKAVHRNLLIGSYDFEFKLFARANGYDLSHDYQSVIDEILEWDADVVFNNAWVPANEAQLNIQTALHRAWADEEKCIITTGSCKGIYAPFMPKEELEQDFYAQEKRKIEDHAILCSLSWPFKNKCRVHTVNFGVTITSLTEGIEDLSRFIPAETAAEYLIDLMEPRPHLIATQMITHQFDDTQGRTGVVLDANMRKSIAKSFAN